MPILLLFLALLSFAILSVCFTVSVGYALLLGLSDISKKKWHVITFCFLSCMPFTIGICIYGFDVLAKSTGGTHSANYPQEIVLSGILIGLILGLPYWLFTSLFALRVKPVKLRRKFTNDNE